MPSARGNITQAIKWIFRNTLCLFVLPKLKWLLGDIEPELSVSYRFGWLSSVWLNLAPGLQAPRARLAPTGRVASDKRRRCILSSLGKIMEYNVLILRSGDWLTANPGECGGIGALATLPEPEGPPLTPPSRLAGSLFGFTPERPNRH